MVTLPQIPRELSPRKTGAIINAPESISHAENHHLFRCLGVQRGENLEKKPQQKENLRLAPTNAEASMSTMRHSSPSVFGEQLFMQFCYLGTEKGPFLNPQLSFSSSPCLPSSVLLKPKPRAGNSRPGLPIKTMENNG